MSNAQPRKWIAAVFAHVLWIYEITSAVKVLETSLVKYAAVVSCLCLENVLSWKNIYIYTNILRMNHTHRIHGTGIFTYMEIIKINQMFVNIDIYILYNFPWILWNRISILGRWFLYKRNDIDKMDPYQL